MDAYWGCVRTICHVGSQCYASYKCESICCFFFPTYTVWLDPECLYEVWDLTCSDDTDG